MVDVIIIGNGPAGVSAAIYIQRAGLKSLIIGKDAGSLGKAEKIENYYGFVNPISGKKLVSSGLLQAKRLGSTYIKDEVTGLNYDGNFIVNTKNKSFTSKSVLIATGTVKNKPKIKGLKEFEGRGVSYCAVCDGFFYRGKDVAVVGNSDYALHEAKELLPLVKSLTLLTNGNNLNTNIPSNINVNFKKILSIEGGDTAEYINFDDGSAVNFDGIFIAIGSASSSDLAKKIGAEIEKDNIVVNKNLQTNIEGLFAAGDCTGGMLQISKAIYEGSKAGTEIIKFIRKNN